MSGIAWLDLVLAAVGVATGLASVVLAGLGLQAAGLALVRRAVAARPAARAEGLWPRLVVQIPVYDEPTPLVARALDAALALRARGPVEVQLLDDSPDPRAGATLCAARTTPDRPVRHLARAARDGFKAGALAAGLDATDAELAAVFDVDFRPHADALVDLVPVLLADPRLAFVQARWTHPEAEATLLGRAQAALLDLHFTAEQGGHDRAGLPVTFNGTAGVWRRTAIEASGGWQGDTLAEDLDLALRAQMAGWTARVLDAVTIDADLPPTLGAWRRQQARWTKGLAEVGRKLLGPVWRSGLPLRARLSVTGQLAVAASLPALLVLVVGHPVLAVAAACGVAVGSPAAWTGWVALASALVAHAVAQRTVAPDGALRRLLWVPLLLAAPLTLAVPAVRGVGQALRGHRTPFARTPKDGAWRPDPDRAWDAVLAIYSAMGAVALVALGAWGPAIVQAGFALAFAVAARPQPRPRPHTATLHPASATP